VTTAVEILLVEDNEKDIELTLHALRSENLGNEIYVARDGEEALQFLAHYETELTTSDVPMPKLIMLDIKLPKVDGLQVLREIKEHEITKLIPVVVLTSSKEDEDMINSYRLGVNSYLQKPVNFEHFRKMVKQLGMYWLVVNRLPSSAAVQLETTKVGAHHE
jgi:two-component system, response regulator